LLMNGQEIDGRAVNIDRSTAPDKSQARDKRAQAFGDQTNPPSSTLFLGNLSYNVSEDTVWSFFNDYGVKSVRLPTDRDSGRPKGFGYVELRMLMALKRHLKQKMALTSRDEVSVWIILNLEILREEVVVEAVDLAIEVAVVVVDLATEVVEVVVDAVDLAIVVVVVVIVVVEVVIVVVVVVVPLEACLKMVGLPPFKVKKSLSKPRAPFRLSVTFAMQPDR